jgi:hypothetical protein
MKKTLFQFLKKEFERAVEKAPEYIFDGDLFSLLVFLKKEIK